MSTPAVPPNLDPRALPIPDPVPVQPQPPVPAQAPGSSSQAKYPWRAVLRTVFAFVVGLASSWGVLVDALHLDPTWGWVTAGGAIAAAITRGLASPTVEAVLHKYAPWLAAEPRP